MTATELRARILLALGMVASCKEGPPADAPVVAVAVTDAGGGPVAPEPPPSEHEDRSCARVDHVVERLCGETPSATSCGSDATRLVRVMNELTRSVEVAPPRDRFVFDAAARPANAGASVCCYTRCTRLDVVSAEGEPPPPGWDKVMTCIAPPARTSMPAEAEERCPAAIRLRGRTSDFHQFRNDECCYMGSLPPCPPGQYRLGLDQECRSGIMKGRPLRENGEHVLAPARGSVDDPEWAAAGVAEHSSIAAFARLSLDLLAHGAPLDLVRDCHVAAIEEIEHARLSLALAGASVAAGPLPIGVSRTSTLTELACTTFLDGCIGETLAALEAEDEASHTADDERQAVLDTIARDEAGHAILAFRVVAWAIAAGGETVRRAVEELAATVRVEPLASCARVLVTAPRTR